MFSFALHHDNGDVHIDTIQSRQGRRLRKSRSYDIVGSLVDVVRDPVRSVGTVLEGLGQWQGDSSQRKVVGQAERRVDAENEAKKQVLYIRLKEADTYAKWHTAATDLDALEGNDEWKAESSPSVPSRPFSSYYNDALIRHRLSELDEARLNHDARKMLFLVRTTLARNLGGMNNIRLYRHSHVGTKVLIEKYIESAVETLHTLLNITTTQRGSKKTQEKLDSRLVLEQLLAARQAFGRSALLLSGGGTFGMNHIGVVKCLWEESLLPRIISGSSAGSIVCSVLATRNDDEIPKILDAMCAGDLAVFEDPEEKAREGLFGAVRRFLTHGAIFESKHLVRVMRGLLGDITFQEAYNRTRRILNICVSSASLYELPRLLNYVTAPNVVIWSAVATSCSVPLVFTPSSLLAKDPKTGEHVPWNGPSPSLTAQRWIDGSVDNDLPMTRLAEMFNVNHFIVSQVNPHVVPFLRSEEGAGAEALMTSGGSTAPTRSWLKTAAMLAKGELLHRMHVLTDMHIFPTTFTKARSILSQRYSGDITILPEIPYSQFPLVLQNPSPEFMMSAMQAGERATWPKLSRIRNALSIEIALDEAVSEARGRVVFSKSQVDLRLGAVGRLGMEKGPRARNRHQRKNEAWQHRSGVRLDDSNDALSRARKRSSKPPPPRKRKPPGHLDIPKLRFPQDLTLSPSSATADDSDHKKQTAAFALSSSPLSSPDSSSTEIDSAFDLDGAIDLSGIRTAVPELWPTTRQLFPSRSQPATPYGGPRQGKESHLFMSPTLTMTRNTSATPSPIAGKDNAASSSGRPQHPELISARTTLAKQSEAERRYKRLFHPRPPTPGTITPPSLSLTPMATTSTQSLPTQPSKNSDFTLSMSSMTPAPNTALAVPPDENRRRKSFSAELIPLDISGTRGMMLRKKGQRHHNRSLSAGLKSLAPPDAR